MVISRMLLVVAAVMLVSMSLVGGSDLLPSFPMAHAIMHPRLMNNGQGECYNYDVPDSQICYPTRCYHLFTVGGATLVPTPIAADQPQEYPKFRCTVQERAVYPGLAKSATPAAVCRYAVCTCKGTSSASCEPGKLGNCWSHTCP